MGGRRKKKTSGGNIEEGEKVEGKKLITRYIRKLILFFLSTLIMYWTERRRERMP